MKRKIYALVVIALVITKSFSCDKTSISVTNIVYDGTYYTYTADVCIGISPNWGETNSFCISVADGGGAVSIDNGGTNTSSFTSNYNYCTQTLSFNGQGCATTAMGSAPAGGTVQSATVSVSGSVSGGDLCFSGGGGNAIVPDDLISDCADCGNPDELCWTVQFSTTTPITSATLDGAEGSSTQCPDEIDTSLPPTPASCTPPTVTGTVDGGSSLTVCEGETINLSGGCSGTCDTDKANNVWSGPDGYSYSAMGGGSASFPLTDAPTATSSGAYTFQNGAGSCFAIATVNVTVIPAPTATLNTTDAGGCTSTDVPVTFTGTGPWTFTYDDGSGSTSVTTSDNPYTISGLTSSTTVSLGAGVTSGACDASLIGTTSGTTTVTISPVDGSAGTDWEVKKNTDYTIDGSGTAGLVGYDTTITAVSTSSGTDCVFLDNDATGCTSGSISVSSLGLSCTTIGIDNIPNDAICFTYDDSKSSNITADLCLGASCVTVAVGGIGGSPYCFDRGDVFNLLGGASCGSGTLTINIADVITGPGKADDDGLFTGWTVDMNDITTTVIDNPTYSWVATSGDADVNDLSCTDCETPVFNSLVDGTGCFDLTVTDGFGCSVTDQVCYSVILGIEYLNFNINVSERNTTLLNWETLSNDFAFFEIERSENGTDFFKIGISNLNEGVSKFSFEDETPLKAAYYRIKGVKKDGSFEYTESKFITLNDATKFEITKIYPQPSTDLLHIETLLGDDSEISFQIIDLTGKKVVSKNYNMKHGNFTTKLDVSHLNSGSYMLLLNNGTKQISTKIVKN